MTSHDVKPDGMSYFLATKASYYYSLSVFKTTKPQLGRTEKEKGEGEEVEGEGKEGGGEKAELDLSRTLELCQKCSSLEPKLATKGFRFIIGALLREV